MCRRIGSTNYPLVLGRRRYKEVVRMTTFSDEAAREVQATIKDMEDAYVA